MAPIGKLSQGPPISQMSLQLHLQALSGQPLTLHSSGHCLGMLLYSPNPSMLSVGLLLLWATEEYLRWAQGQLSLDGLGQLHLWSEVPVFLFELLQKDSASFLLQHGPAVRMILSCESARVMTSFALVHLNSSTRPEIGKSSFPAPENPNGLRQPGSPNHSFICILFKCSLCLWGFHTLSRTTWFY